MSSDDKKLEGDQSVAPVLDSSPAAPLPKPSLRQKILYSLWDSDQHLKSPQERAFVRKLDFAILTCATLGWWMKYIDQNNIVNAYVTGMKEDLQMNGNEYTICLMMYTIAFAIMQIPSNMIALKIQPRICIMVCEIGWTIFTFAQAGVRTSNQMYAFRFMASRFLIPTRLSSIPSRNAYGQVGFFESGFSPIIIFLLGSWYTKPELAKRVAIWHITGFFGSATSGFLQAGVHATLDGKLGLTGWRWLYIICGCMSTPVAISVWFLLPNQPENTKIWYLTDQDLEIAIERGRRIGRAPVTGKVDLKLAKRMFGSWRFWVLCPMYIFYGNSCQANSYMGIYLRSAGWSVTDRNIIPACANLVSMVTDFAWGFGSDLTGNRWGWIVGALLGTTVVGSSILTAWPNNSTAIIIGFFFVAGGYVTAVVWTWANEINNGNAEERALTVSSMNGLFYATNSFLPILIFPQTMAPTFRNGFPSILAFSLVAIALVCLTEFMHRRELRQKAEALPPAEHESSLEQEERELENKLQGVVQPVKNSAAII